MGSRVCVGCLILFGGGVCGGMAGVIQANFEGADLTSVRSPFLHVSNLTTDLTTDGAHLTMTHLTTLPGGLAKCKGTGGRRRTGTGSEEKGGV